MPLEEATTGLVNRVASVGRGLAVRTSALGAGAGAALGAGVTMPFGLAPATGAALTVACAVAGGALAHTLVSRADLTDGVAWLDRRAERLDLIASGVAVADGRARRTELADVVVASASARARAIGWPSTIPMIAALAVITMLVAATALRPRPDRGGTAAKVGTPAASPATMVVARDGGDRGAAATRTGSPGSSDAELASAAANAQASGSPSATPGAILAGRGADTSGIGASAGAVIANQPAVTPATAASRIDVTAPRAGASAEVIAVSPRYRALVTAYLEAKQQR